MNTPRSYEEMSAEPDELAAVSTDVLAAWVADAAAVAPTSNPMPEGGEQ